MPGFAYCLVLHAHLPLVLRHGRWPHGSDWLCEAALECYLPLLETAERLIARGASPKWTIDISPVLAEQLAAPDFRTELEFYVENRRRACRENRQSFSRSGRPDLAALADFWEANLDRMWGLFLRRGRDLTAAFADLDRAGHLETMASAATHGYLPLLARDESIHLQLRTAVETHRRHFGRPPRGIWLPECAYRPRVALASGVRPGIEELLARHDLRFFVVDHHLIAGGQPRSHYLDRFPALRLLAGEPVPSTPSFGGPSPYRVHRIASPGGADWAVAFVRDPRSTLQVWSRDAGYPGDFAYLEFHKKHFPGGLRYWRVTDSTRDLGTKEAYDPKRAEERCEAHARHFVSLVRETLAEAGRDGSPSLVCAPYDAELFGHWWFEGPAWLERVTEGLLGSGIVPMTLSETLEACPPHGAVSLREGSWGEGGDHRIWLNRDTEWVWDRIRSAERDLVELLNRIGSGLPPLLHRVVTQACRELLLLQASDWPFLITTWSARDYAQRRVLEHSAAFVQLVEMGRLLLSGSTLPSEVERRLGELERTDFCFPDLDPAWIRAR
jgi:1,4-alpha-glucan branching enzyme